MSTKTGVNHNSILKWQNMYAKGGIDSILNRGRISFKKPILTHKEHKIIEKKTSKKNDLRNYKKLAD